MIEKNTLIKTLPSPGNADLLSDFEYVPDFIAEFSDVYVMAEVKAQNELTDPVVRAKKDGAVLWCRYASEYNAKSGQKPWIYLLIPDTEICDNRTLKYYRQFERIADFDVYNR